MRKLGMWVASIAALSARPTFCRVFETALSLETQWLRAQARSSFRVALASYTADRIRHALPIIPFTFRNERVQRFENFLLTELGDELF